MRISLGMIIVVVVFLGGVVAVVALALLRKMGVEEPDTVSEITSGQRCEQCEQTTVEKTADGRLSCYGCGHVSAALGS